MADVRIFIDFWNFQLAWNDESGGASCDWKKLPAVLIDQAEQVLDGIGQATTLSLEETLVHASVNPATEAKLRNWLVSFLDNQASFNIKIRERHMRDRTIHCKHCNTNHTQCSNCGARFQTAPEKGIDSAIVTDLLSLAHEGGYDVAILVTADADLIPAVEWVQARGLKVINARWDGQGYDLAHSCWGSFSLNSVIGDLTRAQP